MSLQAFEKTVVADIRAAWDDVEDFAEAEANNAWALVKPIVLMAQPAEMAVLKQFALGVLQRLPGVSDLASLETALLNELESAGAAEIAVARSVGAKVLQSFIAAVAAL